MGLKKDKLGELIELCDDRNTDNGYTLDDVKGISIKKQFIKWILCSHSHNNVTIGKKLQGTKKNVI